MYKKNLDLFHKKIKSGTYKINIDNIENVVNDFCKLVNTENFADINIYKCLLDDVPQPNDGSDIPFLWYIISQIMMKINYFSPNVSNELQTIEKKISSILKMSTLIFMTYIPIDTYPDRANIYIIELKIYKSIYFRGLNHNYLKYKCCRVINKYPEYIEILKYSDIPQIDVIIHNMTYDSNKLHYKLDTTIYDIIPDNIRFIFDEGYDYEGKVFDTAKKIPTIYSLVEYKYANIYGRNYILDSIKMEITGPDSIKRIFESMFDYGIINYDLNNFNNNYYKLIPTNEFDYIIVTQTKNYMI